jgi:hypothetical protein
MTLDVLVDFFGTGGESRTDDNLEEASDFEGVMDSVLPEYLEARCQIQDSECRAENVVWIVF